MNEKRSRDLVFAALVLCLLFFVTRCASVKSWEKERLADPVMSTAIDSDAVMYRNHWTATVEAGRPATSLRGGGCACN